MTLRRFIKVKDEEIINNNKCALCSRETELFYYNFPICLYHWERHCDENKKFNLKNVLEIGDT